MAKIDLTVSEISVSTASLIQIVTQNISQGGLAERVIVTPANCQAVLGGTIDPTKQYFIDGVCDMGAVSITVPSGGINIQGYDFNISKLISSENGYTMFTGATAGDFLANDIAVEVTGVGSQVHALVNSSGVGAYEIDRINFNNCTSLGYLDGYRQGLETGTGRFGGTPELELRNTWVGGYFVDTSIVRSLTDGAYSLYKAGVGFSMASRFRSNANIDLNATVSFFDFSSSNFPNPNTVQLDQCLISRNGVFDATDTTIIPNMDASEVVTFWKGNTGIKNTYVGGLQKITAESATVISAGSTFYDLNGTWGASSLQHFDQPTNGELRHLGVNPIEFQLIIDLTMESISDNVLEIRVARWDSKNSQWVYFGNKKAQVNAFVGGRDIAFLTSVNNITLAQNDKVKLQVANNNGNNNVTAEIDSFLRVIER